jgi:hypothetical protein
MPEPPRKILAVPVEAPAPSAPVAEVRIAADRLFVTIPLPHVALRDSIILVTKSTLQIRSLPGRGDVNLTYPLPVATDVGAFLARELNGVLDIVVMREQARSH